MNTMQRKHAETEPSSRGPGRPVARRTRTFRPNYLSFAGTYQCNLTCPHCCVPIEWPDRLDIKVAVRFLEDAYTYGIRILGFTGKLGLSVDKFHGIRTEALADFCRAARRVFRRDDILSLSYASRRPDLGLEPVRSLAQALDGVVEWSEMLGRFL